MKPYVPMQTLILRAVAQGRPSPVLVARARQLLRKHRPFVAVRTMRDEGCPTYLAIKAVLVIRCQIISGEESE